MNREIEILKRIHDLPVPRDLNPLPEWADPHIVETLITSGYLNYFQFERDEQGKIWVVLRAELTVAGRQLLESKTKTDLKRIATIAAIMGVVVTWLIFLIEHSSRR